MRAEVFLPISVLTSVGGGGKVGQALGQGCALRERSLEEAMDGSKARNRREAATRCPRLSSPSGLFRIPHGRRVPALVGRVFHGRGRGIISTQSPQKSGLNIGGGTRFINPDPIGYKGGLNLYEYAGGNPANEIDLLGMDYMWYDGVWNHVNGTPENSVPPTDFIAPYEGFVLSS